MPSAEDFLDTSISDLGVFDTDIERVELEGSTNSSSWNEPGYEGSIDYRIRQLSYSSILTLHSCPRKFELYKKRTTFRAEESIKSSITFAFGHFVGRAIQRVFEGWSYEQIIWNEFLEWSPDLFAEDEKLNKSFWSAAVAIQKFISLRKSGLLAEYELVYHDGKPATELSFCINLPDGFRYRGHVDVVLRNTQTGEVVVLEIKTTGAATTNPSIFKNSAQAIGYSIVLDHIFPSLSSYKVLYFIYNTKQSEYNAIPFTKTHLQRALWIRTLLLDIETIKSYEEAQIYPMHGESCVQFYRDCEYINSCTLSTEYLTKPCTPEQEDKIEYSMTVGLVDLLESQLEKAEKQ
jgi:hypothetical protein